ncbi:hypothetical protein [Rhizobium leguminosarum]|uniref:hypothetical protein n=1 Tax=Rhizobium leguminosarum TaxID=384 RepID=UPI0013F164C5|nr:hypothetical protein [Rhizobium leguminosarum]MBY5485352.1 hypothetical protein [Rhizobium leguminosarum]
MNWGGLQSHQTIRWAVAYGLFGAPRSGASIAFALAALSITGNPATGATALAAMTTAQLVGALPIARLVTPEVLLWLGCACASSAAISGIEVGAVSLAMGFNLQAGYGAIFTGSLCAASLVGSMGNGLLNKPYSKQQVAAMFLSIIIGMALILQNSFGLSILGCALVGICAPSLGIHYSLQLNRLVTPEMRAEVFSALKISTSFGTILASATLGSTSVTLTLTASMWMLACALVAILSKDFIIGRRLTETRLSGGAGLATAPALTAGRRSERNDR